MQISEIVSILNNDNTSIEDFENAKQEYLAKLALEPRGNSQQDFNIEILFDLGLYSGRDLPVPLACGSRHHNHDGGGLYYTLPYTYKDGRPNALLCKACLAAERSEYEQN